MFVTLRFAVCAGCFAAISAALTPPAAAQTSYPMLMSLKPTAVQVGAATEATLESRYSMFGCQSVLVSGTGVTAEIVTPMTPDKEGKEPKLESIKLKFTVAADALPGVRDFRLLGPTGASTIGQVVVAVDPVVAEQPDNDTLDKGQVIALPATVCGTIEKAEDVDFFRFTVSEPATLQFHCRAMRLEDRIHDLQAHVDPLLTIRSSTGSVVASADNTYAADPLLSCRFDRPGDYLLEVRDSRYQGNAHWTYAIEVSNRPFVATVFPLALAPGAARSIEVIGQNVPAAARIEFAPAADLPAGLQRVRLPFAGGLSNPVSVLVETLPIAEEAADNSSPEQAQTLTIPGVLCGRMESPADVDYFAFEAKKSETFAFEVVARRLDSALDPIVAILNDKKARLLESDDIRIGPRGTQDAGIDSWTAPADGRYVVEIRDLHLRGGTEFVYALRVTMPEPAFDLFLDSDKTIVAPGGCAPLFVRAFRKNGFDGEITLAAEGLPDGVTASAGRILPGKAIDGAILFEAAAGLPTGGQEVAITGRGQVKQPDGSLKEVVVRARPMQEIYMPGGGRSHFYSEQHVVAIAPRSDVLGVKLSTSELSIEPGKTARIDVEIVRAAGFEQNVTLDMVFQHLSQIYANTLPPGVAIDAKASKTLLTSGETKGHIVLRAAPDAAPAERQQCCVLAHVSINFVMKSTAGSKPLWITVPPAEGAAPAAATAPK